MGVSISGWLVQSHSLAGLFSLILAGLYSLVFWLALSRFLLLWESHCLAGLCKTGNCTPRTRHEKVIASPLAAAAILNAQNCQCNFRRMAHSMQDCGARHSGSCAAHTIVHTPCTHCAHTIVRCTHHAHIVRCTHRAHTMHTSCTHHRVLHTPCTHHAHIMHTPSCSAHIVRCTPSCTHHRAHTMHTPCTHRAHMDYRDWLTALSSFICGACTGLSSAF